MKLLILVLLMTMSVVLAETDQVLYPKNSDEILDHLEGNNYNIYILFFAAASPYEEVATRNNRDIAEGLQRIVTDNPEVIFATINHADPNFQKLLQVTGVNRAPSVFIMNHGNGVWIYEGTSSLILDRLSDFMPKFKEAASHQTSPF